MTPCWQRLKRGYTAEDYRRLVEGDPPAHPACPSPPTSSSAFPAKARAQYQRTYDLLADLNLDVAHLARYSPRPGTVAERRLADDVSDEEKWAALSTARGAAGADRYRDQRPLSGESVEVLFEEKVRGRWKGRTPTNKLVFVESDEDLRGQLRLARITWTGPWSMQAVIAHQPSSLPFELFSLPTILIRFISGGISTF